MKKLFFIVGLVTVAASMSAQSVEKANEYLYYERFNSAEKDFQSVLANDPNNDEAWYGLTRAYVLQNQTKSASDKLQSAPASVKDEPYFNAAMGYLYLANSQSEKAAIHFNNALKSTRQKNPGVLSAIAIAHIENESGNANYAIELLNKAIKRDKRNAWLNLLVGNAYSKLNNGSQAYVAYKEAIEKDEKLAAAYYKVAEIFKTQKNQEMYLEYYNKAVAADENYAPALYRLYAHYFYYDPAKSLDFYKQFQAKSDPSAENAYDLADLYYVNKKYDEAIEKTKSIISASEKTEPRLYKLLAYSYAGLKDSAQAITLMQQYFSSEADSNFMAKDFVLMSNLYNSSSRPDSAIAFLVKAAGLETDSTLLRRHYKDLAVWNADLKDYSSQAKWLGYYYSGNEKANNLDLFNWALAYFRAEDYVMADSVFGMYVTKYPEQSFGYYWQARANAALDKEMENGLALPHYMKLIEVLQDDTKNPNYKSWMIQAYGYLATYEANMEKDYPEAVNYFEKVLEVDPANEEAKKYISVLEQRINAESNNGTK
jgi:tetratricopeptide (TPR) repeat protein